MTNSKSDFDTISEAEHERERERSIFLYRLHWWLSVATAIMSAVAIALAYAKLTTLAIICAVPIGILLIAVFYMSYYRYQRNKRRRDEIIDTVSRRLDAEHANQLRAYFNGVQLEQGDQSGNSLFDKTLKEIEDKTAAEEARQRSQTSLFPKNNVGRPPKKGGNK